VGELVNKDTDGDGIPDWEESLYGLDPTKKETNPGIPDSVAIQNLISQNQTEQGLPLSTNQGPENLTQTDKFSREFLTTLTTLAQNGAIDANGNMYQATQDQITNSLINSIQNSPQRKIYQLSDIKIINDNSVAAVKKYNTALNNAFPKGTIKNSVIDIFQKFAPDDTGNNTDPSVLPELSPIIKQMTDSLNGMLTAPVPQVLATLHLYMINDLEGMIENLSDVQQYNTDPIVAFSGMSKYEQNSSLFTEATQYIAALINMKFDKVI
jgi:hypothetical protein